MPRILEIPPETYGLDCDTPVSYESARRFFKHKNKYRYIFRYVARDEDSLHDYDLTTKELEELHQAGLGVMPVQHVLKEGWQPTAVLGSKYGVFAAQQVHKLGFSHGVNVWLDLEGVDESAKDTDIIKYCNNWYWMVSDFGMIPGLYIGWHSGLTARQLFVNLAFQHYWGAYNINGDEIPYKRGLQLRQIEARTSDRPPGIPFEFDVNISYRDELGGLPLAFVPNEWTTD